MLEKISNTGWYVRVIGSTDRIQRGVYSRNSRLQGSIALKRKSKKMRKTNRKIEIKKERTNERTKTVNRKGEVI